MKPIVGLSMWDIGGWDHESKRAPVEEDFYEQVLAKQIESYYGLLNAAELAQEADFQNKDIRTWNRLDLMEVPGFSAFLLNCQRLAVHLRHGNVDIADHENQTHRRWSLAEVKKGIEFALRIGADACILHAGTYNERAGRFWPGVDEVKDLMGQRETALESSLAELSGILAAKAAEQETRLREFEEREKGIFSELSALLKEMRFKPRGEERIRLLGRGLELIRKGKLTAEQVRHCQEPWAGMHICVENLEPPNFLVCSPQQVRKIHSKFSEYFQEAAAHGGLSAATTERYRPMFAVDPGHMLNSKVILTQPNNRPYLEALEGGEEFHLDFVRLPGQFSKAEARDGIEEPMLNRFVRLNGDDIFWAHLYGCTRTDTCMTTHGPIKAFRTSVLLERGPDGEPYQRFGTGSYRPNDELNLEEVVQVIGTHVPYIAEVFGAPVEIVKSSALNTYHFLDYLNREHNRAASLIRKAIGKAAEEPGLNDAKRDHLRWLASALVNARAYIRPRPSSLGFWSVGYDEVGFYQYVDNPSTGNTDIFATIKHDDNKIWLKGLE